MAFCENCGAQVGPGSVVCPSCGAAVQGSAGAQAGMARAPAVAQYTPVTAAQARGFLASLFDLSFTSFVASKLIKVLYVIAIAVTAVVALSFALAGFSKDVASGLLMLIIVTPLVFLAGVIYARVVLEIIIVVFRMAEHLEEIAQQGRRAWGTQ